MGQPSGTMRNLMSTLSLLKMFPAGEGWDRPISIARWSGISMSTTYRYLPKLEMLGFIKSREYECRKMKCKEYRITDAGEDYVNLWKKLL